MKLPPEAKKVFDGLIFDVYQWPVTMYDGSAATFEGLKRPNTIEIIAVSGNEIIISEQEQPHKPLSHSLFGGRQEPNEEPLEAAKRELLEESGLESNDWELYKTYEFTSKMEWTNYFYIARNCKKVADQNLDPGERITVKPVSFDEFVRLITQTDFWVDRNFIIDLFRIKEAGKLIDFKQRLGLS